MANTSKKLKLSHLLMFGRWQEKEDDEGKLMRHFRHIHFMWADISLIPLTLCLPFGVSNESRSKQAKAVYKVKVRSYSVNALTPSEYRKINAVELNRKILLSAHSMVRDPNTDIYEGFFYDYDLNQEIY